MRTCVACKRPLIQSPLGPNGDLGLGTRLTWSVYYKEKKGIVCELLIRQFFVIIFADLLTFSLFSTAAACCLDLESVDAKIPDVVDLV